LDKSCVQVGQGGNEEGVEFYGENITPLKMSVLELGKALKEGKLKGFRRM